MPIQKKALSLHGVIHSNMYHKLNTMKIEKRNRLTRCIGRMMSLACLIGTVSPVDAVNSLTSAQTDGFHTVDLHREITHVQPMTGLVLWRDHDRMEQYSHTIALEYHYCLPCRVVTGKKDGLLQYDWTYLEEILNDIASRNHQAVLRFWYEYPSNTAVDGKKGTTAVPQYIKDQPDYHETYSKDPGGDGPTYYADWSNAELQWFTKQFYSDFAARYNSDSRIAFLEVGFGHWSEYHIYGTPLKLGTNFPSHAYQKSLLQHLDTVLNIPWAISIDAADRGYTPIVGDAELMSLRFGSFDDSFMHKGHELGSGNGYNEECWNAIGQGTRWQRGVCGGEISYYTDKDQKNFLNPVGMYGVVWEDAAAKYHLSFMIANDAPGSQYGTVARFQEAGMATGYRFVVTYCATNGMETHLTVRNEGIAPFYRDAYFAIGTTASKQSLRGLLPGQDIDITIPAGLANADDLHITSPAILPSQTIEFTTESLSAGVKECSLLAPVVRKRIQGSRFVVSANGKDYDLVGHLLH